METESSIIKDTEMQENLDYQPCGSVEIIEVPELDLPVNLETNSSATVSKKIASIDVCINNSQEEPIDLTFDRKRLEEKKNGTEKVQMSSHTRKIIIQAKRPEITRKTVLSRKTIKRSVDVLNSTANREIIPLRPLVRQKTSAYGYAIIPAPQQDLGTQLSTHQQEILKVAKSIFSKRTRTLYHWMYPTASKLQIKQVVSSTWDSMPSQEKNIYIAQVLGRFGYNNANLMVNPQLGQIKELPPTPGIQEFNPKASELQNAISSISHETNPIEPRYVEQPRKKLKNKTTQNLSTSSCSEFDDDPELSQELAQFSRMLKNQF